jgi:hypothetical protein
VSAGKNSFSLRNHCLKKTCASKELHFSSRNEEKTTRISVVISGDEKNFSQDFKGYF